MSTSIQQLLDNKTEGNELHSVNPDTLVYDAIKLMSEVQVGALVVLDNNNKLAGIISERDYTRKIILQNRSSRDTPVRDIMTENVLTVSPDQSMEECMVIMSKNHIRHMPVVEGDRVIGIVSVMDVMKNIISEKEFIISQLENYISGTA